MQRDVRLAVVTDAVEPFHTGGKEARYGALLPRLSRRGVRVQVHTMAWWGAGPAPGHRGLDFRALGPRRDLYTGDRRSIWQAVTFAFSTLRLLARRFDVVEADAIPFLPLFPLRLVTWVRRRPLVVTWHEVWGREYWRAYLGVLGNVAAAVERLSARLPDHVVAASEGTAERLIALGVPAARLSVIPNGVDEDEVAAASPDPTVGDILCVGRLIEHKRVDLLLEALAVLRGRGQRPRTTIIGTGPEEDRLHRQVIELGLEDQVRIVPPLPGRADLLGAVKGARVLAFPSIREGFGMVALEAMACGTAVVTSDHPDNLARHLVTDGVTGRVVEPSPTVFADALAQALDHADEWGEAARASVRGYSWDSLADRLAEVVRR